MSGGTELLAPAGDFATALAAFAAGADAVYCGLGDFSARAFAPNLSEAELRDLLRVAHAPNRSLRGEGRVYVTFNTLVDEADFAEATRRLARLDDLGVDGLIVQDLGVARLCRERFPRLALHASTQLVAHNLEGVLALKELGFRRVVLARELSLEEVASIARRCGVEVECFIHGALCYSLSGLCLFSALEKGRSGNRGRCAYCCRTRFDAPDGSGGLPFSMKDLRLGAAARRLAEAGVASLKIEGRMKSDLYVASVTRHYRDLLDGAPPAVSPADLETVFSRRTTPLYLDGFREGADIIDASSLGHLGTPIGTVKRITRDREGRRWLRVHTARALERHDGLQFLAPEGGKPCGFGISEMRQAISRVPVYEVAAGTDAEILLPDGEAGERLAETVHSGDTVFCSMSNAVKRRFPVPAFRPSDWPGTRRLAVTVTVGTDAVSVAAEADGGLTARADGSGAFPPAANPAATDEATRRAFAKLGGTDYRLDRLTLINPDGRFVPPSVLNTLRREVVARLEAARAERLAAAARPVGFAPPAPRPERPLNTVKVRPGQAVPDGAWDEVVVGLDGPGPAPALPPGVRVALPVYTREPDFSRLRTTVKGLLRQGFAKWEASDLATLRLLRTLGVADITADWTLYAFNAAALAQLAELGVGRVVASPENDADNRAFLAASGHAVEFLVRQSTPLFLSLHKPAGEVAGAYTAYRRGALWATVRTAPRRFEAPAGAARRTDMSWDAA